LNKLKEYFTYTRAERNGILVLLSIIILLFVIPFFIENIYKNKKVDYSVYEANIDKFTSILIQNNNKKDSVITNNNYTIKPFNPNIVSEQELIEMGLPKKIIKIWINYRNKNGYFKNASDVRKIYGMTDSIFNIIEPYLFFDSNKSYEEYFNKNKVDSFYHSKCVENYNNNKTNEIIELNSADSVTLCKIPGIGGSYARSILKYKIKLGGFVRKEQLLEVYGMTQESYNKIISHITISTKNIKLLNINEADFKTLLKHPYFNKDLINRLLEYRKIQGKINHIQEVVKNKIISQDEANKISPYIEY